MSNMTHHPLSYNVDCGTSDIRIHPIYFYANKYFIFLINMIVSNGLMSG